jgi:putative hemolysin
MKKIFIILGAGLALAVLAGAGCAKTPASAPMQTNKNVNAAAPQTNENANAAAPTAGLANPASVNCIQKGGKLEIRENKLGQYGVCLFEDNRQCEEWALMRGQCPAGGLKITGYDNDAEIYCAITGGTVQGVGTKTPMCRRTDGTLCTAEANFNGDCPNPK